MFCFSSSVLLNLYKNFNKRLDELSRVEPLLKDLFSQDVSVRLQVTEDGAASVYSRLLPDWHSFSVSKLDLSTAGSVTLTEFDGKIFTGTYSVATDGLSLTLNGLTSAEGAPTGTGGTISYTILSTPTATGLSLQQTTAYVKASSAIVKLALVNP